jgi:hypothetical protein
MSESNMRRRLILKLKSLHAIAVENPIHPGTPDVNYSGGWIELKWMKKWKDNADKSAVLIHHFTEQQKRWLRKRTEAGGKVFLMLQVGSEYFLFKGDVAAAHVGRIPRGKLIELSYKYWPKGVNQKELIECLI